MNKEYWKIFYQKQKGSSVPSLFAEYIAENYLKKNETLIELGCGNGRDSVYFSQKGIDVLAVDQCPKETLRLITACTSSNLRYLCADFTNLPEWGKFNNVYSRFTLHAISEKQEDRVLKWVYDSLEADGLFFVEARGHKNELYKKGEAVEGEIDAYIYENHYRRFLDNEKIVSKLKGIGFEIIYNEERCGFSPYKNEDQVFIRLVCRKNGYEK